ncbi:MAG TPA: glutathione S-transferase family protein [Gammaproteobacteria bacterium]|nr:glutathione S-transferase family protein [Gammaproteobacteria bacterium]
MKLVLYYHPGTRSQRVRWLLEELGLDYELRYVDLFKGEANTDEYLALQPLGQLPAMKIDDDVMFESGAIVQWLADSYLEKGFAPALDSPLRRQFDQWMYFAVTNLEEPAWEIMLHSRILPEDVAVKAIVPFATQTLLKALTVLDKALQGKEYMLGSGFSAVDIMIAYILMWYPEHVEPFSNLKTYAEKLRQRPAYIRSTQD